MIKCSDIIERNHFESYSEFYLAMCMARECLRRGKVLDMSDMRIDSNILPQAELDYFKYLIKNGAIYVGEGVQAVEINSTPTLLMNTECFDDLYNVLFNNIEGKYLWTFQWASEKYSKYFKDMLNLSNMGNILMHLVAHMLICFYLQERVKQPIEIVIEEQKVRSTYIYVNLLSCSKTLEWFNDLVILDIDFSDFNVDLDYSILCNNGIAANRNKLWSIHDKYKFLKQEGFEEGMIAILWKRKGMCESNPAGRIIDAKVIKINEISETCLYTSIIPVYKTKEEVRDDYEEIPEDRRYIFMDMLYNKPNVRDRNISMYELGINNYFDAEPEFITKIDTMGSVVKKITVDGVVKETEMSQVDAIYWLLCQYEIDFDRELYKQVYNGGEDLLWDKYGEY